MLPIRALANVATRESSVSLLNLILVIPLLMPVAGCTNDGAGGPIISRLSTPTDATAGLESDDALHSTVADSGEVGEEDPIITMTSTPDGVTARLAWDHPSDIRVTGYYIYYEKRSSEEPSSEESISEESSGEALSSEESHSCSHGDSLAIEAPPATITGLEPNTRYSFAIRAFNESESLCSNEITAVTPPVQP